MSAESHSQPHHIVPVKIYIRNFLVLMALMILTVAVASVPLGSMNVVVALAVAVTKATLIILFFMHVKYSSKLTWVFVGGAFVWFALMMVLVSMDFASRYMQTYGAPWH